LLALGEKGKEICPAALFAKINAVVKLGIK